MQEYLGLLIAVARRRLKQAVLARMRERKLRLSVQQFWILSALRELPGVSQISLAERLRTDAPTVSRTLGGLIDRRLVRTETDVADRRRTSVWLTPQGERLAAELAPLAEEIRDAVVAGMSTAEVAAVQRGLLRAIANLEKLLSDKGARPPGARRRAAGQEAFRD